MHTTHTWMGDSIKVSLVYKHPFWQEPKTSGTLFSNVGPIPEMYDHSDVANEKFALTGFFKGVYYSLNREERKKMVLQQLKKYYGEQVLKYIRYEEKVWRNNPYTYSLYDQHVLPHQHQGHPLYQLPYLDDSLYIAGTETSTEYPGYMEGSVRSAANIAAKIKSKLVIS